MSEWTDVEMDGYVRLKALIRMLITGTLTLSDS